MTPWEVFAVKYADRNARTRRDSFLFDDDHHLPHDMDYFIWVLRRGNEIVLVDTGYDQDEGDRRGRPVRLNPVEALAPLGIVPEAGSTIIVTHLHYDHAGGLKHFPNATIHIQAAEMAYATGPCMCHDALRMPFTAGHVCEAVKRLYTQPGGSAAAPVTKAVKAGRPKPVMPRKAAGPRPSQIAKNQRIDLTSQRNRSIIEIEIGGGPK